ncbi:hypothetical protein GGH12_004862 [Coemansia sp. RSA 1822]|nr:hypothetical protein LPJ76_002642 [Coemansia sp. RSA 638]KAJ2542693.1 hypothetical protein GGF49_002643 [Coemansia sp. RSA 1853]KAJ2560372.1 hypothetical protein GGH12_004862 [Coemansia sp. RSA 1822]
MDCLPRELRMLQSITIESNEQCTHEELIEYDWATRLYLPVLATINVVYNSAVSPFPMLAPILARTIMQCADKQTGLVLNLRSAHNMAYTIVAPAWIDCAQMLTTLAFTNMDVIPSAMHAVRMCCKTLERLEFLHCSYEQFKHMVYDDKESPVEYPKLRYIRGALSQPMSSTFTVPHVFPRLERVHEACAFEWQNMGRVVPHLLVNTLMKIELPRLHELVVQTSRDMDLHLTNVPNLTCVRYYRPERLEPMDARNVVGQLGRLFMVRNLQYLRFGDHLPSLHITGNFRIACVCLEYLDVGTIMLSLSTTIHILQSLSMLHSLKCALSQAWTSHKAMLELNDCLSRSVRLIKVYVVGQAKGVTPVDEVVARLPMLTHVQVQEGARNMREFVERMKHEHRFEWSARVADRIHIETVNFT